jgi:hypothetical protein
LDFKIEFSQLDTPLYNLIPREPKPFVYPANFDAVPVSTTNASISKIESIPSIEIEENKSIQSLSNDEIEFSFEENANVEEEKNKHTSIDIEFEDSINTTPEIVNEIIADNELALEGQIEFEAPQNSQMEMDNEEEPLILEFEEALSLEANKITVDTPETIEFGVISAPKTIEIEPETIESKEEPLDTEVEVGNETDSNTLFDDERHRAKILTAIKMRDLNFDAQKITDITGISLKEMNDFEAYSRLNEEKEQEEIHIIEEAPEAIEKAEENTLTTDSEAFINSTENTVQPKTEIASEIDLKTDTKIQPISIDNIEVQNNLSATDTSTNNSSEETNNLSTKDTITNNSSEETKAPKISEITSDIDTEINSPNKMEETTLIHSDIEENNSDKLPFLSWLDKLNNPTATSSEEEELEDNQADKTATISLNTNPIEKEAQNDFEFESTRYILDEGEFNEPIKNYIQEQIETKKTKINPEETYKPKSIETIDFNEIVSETLAKLYVKQGHKEKGINMYDKLILKFPEKSVYFASEIEKLK